MNAMQYNFSRARLIASGKLKLVVHRYFVSQGRGLKYTTHSFLQFFSLAQQRIKSNI